MNVLHVYRKFHPEYTGDGIYFTNLIPRMRRHGIDGSVLAYETPRPSGAGRLEHRGVVIDYLADQPEAIGHMTLIGWLLRNIGRFDIVHLHSHVDRTFLSYALCRLLGRRVIFSCTLDDSPTQIIEQYRPTYRRLVRVLSHAISDYVVISPQLLRLSLRTVRGRRLNFIPQGFVLKPQAADHGASRAAARAALGFAASDFVLLHVGSISRRKNIAFMVETLAAATAPQARLVVVGPVLEADYEAKLMAQVAAAGLQDRVLLAGFVDDPSAFYQAADAFIFASFAEGFPNVLVEAMAYGVPIIARFLPGLTDFIISHETQGLLVREAAEAATALDRLAAEPELATAMGAANRRFAERNLDIDLVAGAYAELYRRPSTGLDRPVIHPPELDVRFTGRIAPGPASIGLAEFDTPRDWPPLLQVVIDTEASFEWDKGTYTDSGRINAILDLEEGLEIFRRRGVLPTLVIDHPVASQRESSEIIRRLAAAGCDIGVHLHPWSTPPMVEPRDDWHSFSGNLGPGLERVKLARLSERVAAVTGEKPRIFKAGRYGIGPHTIDSLAALGFTTDLSICPAFDYGGMGGPDFSAFTSRPGWVGRGQLLSLPTTAGHLGWLSRQPWVRRRLAGRLGRQKLLARANALYPVRLSPEGNDLITMTQLTRRLLADGLRVFTLSLHSPTLSPGNTPYTRSAAELAALLVRTAAFLDFFRDELGGTFVTTTALERRLRALARPEVAAA